MPYYLAGYPSGGDDVPELSAAITSMGSIGGGTIMLRNASYKFKSTLPINYDNIGIRGHGTGTIINIDDSGGAVGDGISVNSTLNFSLKDVLITSTTARSAGAAIKVKGANNITAAPAQRTRQWTITDVNFENQFNGIVINDGPTALGAWGGYMDRVEMMAFAAGGVGIDINTPAGGQQYINNVKIYGASTGASATRALAGVRIRGCNDVELHNVNVIYTQYGLRIDPPSGQNANVVLAAECLWDSTSVLPCSIEPASGGTANLVRLVENWFGVATAVASVDCIHIAGASKSIFINGGYIIGPAVGVKADGTGGATDIHVTGRPIFTGGTKGFWATGSLQDFSCNGEMGPQTVLGALAPAVGIQVDAGCDYYELYCNIHRCSTPITDNGGAHKVVANL